MADLSNQFYSFDEDGILRLQKDLNYMFYHLDEKNVRRLYTEYCEIKSKEGETEIDGPLIVMRGDPGTTNSTTIRIKMGWDKASSEFVFNIYGQDGTPSVELDSTGDAVFKGSINTADDVYLGNRVFVGWQGTTSTAVHNPFTRGIFIQDYFTTMYAGHLYTTSIPKDTSGGTGPNSEYEVTLHSSGGLRISSKYYIAIEPYCENLSSMGVGTNSTDGLYLWTPNRKICIGGDETDRQLSELSTEAGVSLGSATLRDVYIGCVNHVWQNKVASLRDLEVSFSDTFRYYHVHNTKYITRLTTNWTPNSTDSSLVGTTRAITSTRGCSLLAETSNSASGIFYGGNATIASVDLTQFHDGTALTSDDYLVALIWHPGTTGWIIYDAIRLGSGSTDYYTYSFYGFEPGWNIQKIKLGDYDSITGSPSFNNISYVQVYTRLSSSFSRPANTYVSYFDYIGVIRADPVNGTNYSAFQKEINSSHKNILQSQNGDILYGTYNPSIQQIGHSVNGMDMYLRTMQDFDVELGIYSLMSNESPIIFAGDTDYNIQVRVSSGALRLSGEVNGTTFGDYINCPAYTVGSYIELGLRRYNNVYIGWYRNVADNDSYREIANYQGTVSTYLAFMDIYLGTAREDAGMQIHRLNIKSYTDELEV
jgi:hypothetical protein